MGGAASEYTGENILRKSGGGVILIVIQYRLGLFGFLPGQKVKDGGQLNAGLRKLSTVLIFICLTFDRGAGTEDQRFALKWAQDHIHSSASLTR